MRELFDGQDVVMGGDDVAISSLVYDSRKVESGSLFLKQPETRVGSNIF